MIRSRVEQRDKLNEFDTFPTSVGMFNALVAKPIPKAIASSVPRNWASSDSSFRCWVKVPETDKLVKRGERERDKDSMRTSQLDRLLNNETKSIGVNQWETYRIPVVNWPSPRHEVWLHWWRSQQLVPNCWQNRDSCTNRDWLFWFSHR